MIREILEKQDKTQGEAEKYEETEEKVACQRGAYRSVPGSGAGFIRMQRKNAELTGGDRFAGIYGSWGSRNSRR